MKRKITLLILAICMATVAVPQKLFKQDDKKVFAFEGRSFVLKIIRTNVYSYDRAKIDSGYEPVNEYATLFSILDTVVTERVEARFPIKDMGLMGHYDTADYRKAFSHPEELFYSAKQDTINVLKNYFFTKETTIKKYGISFDGSAFILDVYESSKQESIALWIILIWLIPCLVVFTLIVVLMFIDKDLLLTHFSPNKPRKDKKELTLALWIIGVILALIAGMSMIGFFIDPANRVDVYWPVRLVMIILRFIFAYHSIRFVNNLFIKLAGNRETKMGINFSK